MHQGNRFEEWTVETGKARMTVLGHVEGPFGNKDPHF